ncbi:unnamed protein product [Closterium sp. Naga37s-1]|nr:unnamed protein product [Closterium sp. Naga37s-1]
MGVFEGNRARMQAEEVEELKIVEAASQTQQEQQQEQHAEKAYQKDPEAMAALELEAIQCEELEQAEQPRGIKVFELFELQQQEKEEGMQGEENPEPFQENSQLMQQTEGEGVAVQQAGGSATIRGMEAFEVGPLAGGCETEGTVKKVVDAGSLPASQAAAMEEETERQADASVGAVKELEEQEVPVRLV